MDGYVLPNINEDATDEEIQANFEQAEKEAELLYGVEFDKSK